MRDSPVCLCQWYHARKSGTAERLAERALKEVPEAQRAYVEVKTVLSRQQFIDAIRAWYATSSNTQYLLVCAHGVQNQTGGWVGIGSTLDDAPATTEDCITWRDFWHVVVRAKTKPPALLLVGCKTAEAVKAFAPPLLTKRQNNPYLIGLTEVVTSETSRMAFRLVGTLLQNIHDWGLSIDAEVEVLKKDYPDARLYYPVVALKGKPARYVEADRMAAEVGMGFSDYLDLQNRWLAKQGHPRHP